MNERVPAEFRNFPETLVALAPFGPYRAVVKHVVDGDTFDVFVDGGLNGYRYVTLRLLDFNAWEMRGEEREKGKAAKAHLESLCLGKPIVAYTTKDLTFGRYLARVVLASGVNVADAMRAAGHERA